MGSYTPRKPTIVTVGYSPELARALEPVKQSVEMITGARVGTPEIEGLPSNTSGIALISKINEIITRLNASGRCKIQRETSAGVMADVGLQVAEVEGLIGAKLTPVATKVTSLSSQLASASERINALSTQLTNSAATIATMQEQINTLTAYATALRKDVNDLMGKGS